MNYTFPYWGPFVWEGKVEQEFVDILVEKGNESRKKQLDHRNQLAGFIENEYYYEDFESWFLPKFNPYIDAYIKGLQTHWLPNEKPIKEGYTKGLWINYHKANEYNPPHDHDGDLSFVIYLQVPIELKKELKENKLRNSGPGVINFSYGEKMPFSINLFSRLPSTGDMFIFPAWLTHFVNAFKSDVERISVSGNVIFNYDKV